MPPPPLSTSAPSFCLLWRQHCNLGVPSCFSSWNVFLLTLGRHEQYFGGAQARNVLQWHRASHFLSGHNPRLGGTLFAWETHFSHGGGGEQAVIWGTRLRNAPRGAGPEWSSARNKLKPKKKVFAGFWQGFANYGYHH